MGDNKYIPLIIKSDDADPIKYYSTSVAAKHWGSVIFLPGGGPLEIFQVL